jgi:putative DNA primase/helicase
MKRSAIHADKQVHPEPSGAGARADVGCALALTGRKQLAPSTTASRGVMARTYHDGQRDHLDWAHMVIKEYGSGNLLKTQEQFWRWEQWGVWSRHSNDAVKQMAQKVISAAGGKVTNSLVNGVTEVLGNHLHRENLAFNQAEPEAVNCRNGVLKLIHGTWTRGRHERDQYQTTQLPINHDPKARAPRFEEFLDQTFYEDADKADKIKCVLEMMGYTLMRHARHEKFVILIGNGANGKSVLLNVLEALCGEENIAGVQPAGFDKSFQRAHLLHKLANIVSELKQGEVLPDAELKSIVSGETSTVEEKFKPPFTMRPYATCWFGTNHQPSTRDYSQAIMRRAVIITFNRTVRENEKDTELANKLCEELPGILNLCLEAYARVRDGDFTIPASSAAAVENWRNEVDPLKAFVGTHCTRDHKGGEQAAYVYQRYESWHQEEGHGPLLSRKAFRTHMTRLGFTSKRTAAGNLFVGLLLN